MQSRLQKVMVLLLAGLAATAPVGLANNVCVTNISLADSDTGYTHVQCSVSWDNSWRASRTEGSTTVTNWDAAWVFVKFRVSPGGAWQHASLSTNRPDHTVPAGTALDVGLTGSKGMGVFLYRSAEGGGAWTNTVKLRWNYKQDGLARTDPVDVSVQAVEMVYVPQGSYYAGDGSATSLAAQFENGQFTNALLITSEDALTLGGGALGSLGNNNKTGQDTDRLDDFDDTTSKSLPAAFPKGYRAFYCMKYEVSQGQYADFLTLLTPAQAQTRYSPSTYGQFYYTITNTANVYSALAPDFACNYISWGDTTAYMDWAGLRPLTELEFEKACRGPATPVASELAWGDTTWIKVTNVVGVAGSGTETALPVTANCNIDQSVFFLTRCGLFATDRSNRKSAGAAYWGVMEMSGNMWERIVSVGHAGGRVYTGTHGDGLLTGAGDGNGDTWPGADGLGAGLRGGNCYNSMNLSRLSERFRSTISYSPRDNRMGCRGVRTAP